jgi:hypothetical protein
MTIHGRIIFQSAPCKVFHELIARGFCDCQWLIWFSECTEYELRFVTWTGGSFRDLTEEMVECRAWLWGDSHLNKAIGIHG